MNLDDAILAYLHKMREGARSNHGNILKNTPSNNIVAHCCSTFHFRENQTPTPPNLTPRISVVYLVFINY